MPNDATPCADALPPLTMNAKQAARFIGIGVRTLWRLANAGEIPHARIGRRVVYPVAKLEAWLAERTEGGER